jgi:hypothetical protein
MTVTKTLLTAAVVMAFGLSGRGIAADTTPTQLPAAITAGPTVQGSACASCASGLDRFGSCDGGCKSCHTCGHLLHVPDRGPFVVNLCPGACFGYFQTQWRKWENVCPYPYQGINVNDAAKAPSPSLPSTSDKLPPMKKPDTLTEPRKIDPNTGLPVIPMPGKN